MAECLCVESPIYRLVKRCAVATPHQLIILDSEWVEVAALFQLGTGGARHGERSRRQGRGAAGPEALRDVGVGPKEANE